MSFMLESLVVVALAGVVFFVFENWLRVWEQRVPSPFARTLYRAGADPQRLAAPAAACEIALAEQSCPTCPAIGACRAWLESGSVTSTRSFCPNAALVERLTGN
jgi:hypothetical protein